MTYEEYIKERPQLTENRDLRDIIGIEIDVWLDLTRCMDLYVFDVTDVDEETRKEPIEITCNNINQYIDYFVRFCGGSDNISDKQHFYIQYIKNRITWTPVKLCNCILCEGEGEVEVLVLKNNDETTVKCPECKGEGVIYV